MGDLEHLDPAATAATASRPTRSRRSEARRSRRSSRAAPCRGDAGPRPATRRGRARARGAAVGRARTRCPTRAGDERDTPALAGRPSQRRSSHAGTGLQRIDHRSDAEVTQHVAAAADMIAMGVSDHERRRARGAPSVAAAGRLAPRADRRRRASHPAGVSRRIPSPWPTSRNVTRRPAGGRQVGGGWRAHQPTARRASSTTDATIGRRRYGGAQPEYRRSAGDDARARGRRVATTSARTAARR